MKVLVLGAAGMLGNAMLRLFAEDSAFDVKGTVRNATSLRHLPATVISKVIAGIDVENADHLCEVLDLSQPDVIINCVGLVKQRADAGEPLAALPINAMLPHRLARLAKLVGARLIQPSTDCVFSGRAGNYSEADTPDATDLYGRSKLLGELEYLHTITLRTSIIGHELTDAKSLIGWFLAQQGNVRGYTRAIFSGLPTVELARIVKDFVLPRPELFGVYHVSAQPIAKYELLKLVASAYAKQIHIEPDDSIVIDRSLNSARFRKVTGYAAAPWPRLVETMREFA